MSAAPSEGKPVAVVTGASSGIGLSVVNSLLARGFFVVATMRRVADAPAELVDAPHAVVRPLDVTSDDSVAALAEWLGDDGNVGRCDVLVNNAGFGVPGTVETVPLDTAMRVFDVNVWGVVRMCKAVLPIMRASGRGGLVIVVSSTSGVRSLPCTDFYAGSKFAYVLVGQARLCDDFLMSLSCTAASFCMRPCAARLCFVLTWAATKSPFLSRLLKIQCVCVYVYMCVCLCANACS
jgi:NAD(P)-dependent dehydrogenase (short-subunit alcohol dehydrogenase family)